MRATRSQARIPVSELAGEPSGTRSAARLPGPSRATWPAASTSGSLPTASQLAMRPHEAFPERRDDNGSASSMPGAETRSPQERTDDIGTLLRDFFRSIYFYSRIGFVSAVIVLVIGIIWWSGLTSSANVSATIIKKNLVETWWQPRSVPDNWLRTLAADQAYLRSEEVGSVAQSLIVALGRLSERELDALARHAEHANGQLTEWVALIPQRTESVPIATVPESAHGEEWMSLSSVVEQEPGAVVLKRSLAGVLAQSYRDVRDSHKEEVVQSIAQTSSPRSIARMVQSSLQSDSGEITVRASHHSPEIAAFFANLLPAAFVAINDRQVIRTNSNNLRLHRQRKQDAEAQLKVEESRRNRMRIELDQQLNEVAVHGTKAGQGMDLDSMRSLVATIESRVLEFRSEKRQLEFQRGLLEQEYRDLTDPLLRDKLELEQQIRALRPLLRPENPRMRNLERQLEEVERAMVERDPDDFQPMQTTYHQAAAAKWKLDDLNNRLRQLESTIEAETQRMEDLQVRIERFPELAASLETHQVDVASARQRLERYTEAYEHAQLKAAEVDQYYQWQHSALASNAQMESKSQYLFLIVLLALAAGVAVTQLAAIFDSRVQTEVQARSISGGRALVSIPALGRASRFICRDTPDGRQTNNYVYNLYGILALNLRHLGFPKAGRTLTVTSTAPGEGKSFVAFNLATYYAMQGMRTCLLHTDYRHASLEMFPDLDPDAIPGFVELLAGNGEIRKIEQCLYPTDIPNLFVCPPGRLTAAPSQIIDDDGFAIFLDDLRERFDAVIVDSAPMLLVVDSAVVARQSDATLLVTGLGVVKKAALQTCMDRLALQNINVLGTVINRDRMASQSYYYREYGNLIQIPQTIDPLHQTVPKRLTHEEPVYKEDVAPEFAQASSQHENEQPREQHPHEASADYQEYDSEEEAHVHLGGELQRALARAEAGDEDEQLDDETMIGQDDEVNVEMQAYLQRASSAQHEAYGEQEEEEAHGRMHAREAAAAVSSGAQPAAPTGESDSWPGAVSSRRTPVAPKTMRTVGSVDDVDRPTVWEPFGYVVFREGQREGADGDDQGEPGPTRTAEDSESDPVKFEAPPKSKTDRHHHHEQLAETAFDDEGTEFEPSLPGDATEGLPFDDELFPGFDTSAESEEQAFDGTATEQDDRRSHSDTHTPESDHDAGEPRNSEDEDLA